VLDWDQGRVNANGAELRYFRSGGDHPPLVFVHGFTDHALYFTRAADELAKHWDVVAYDARGHGQSDRVTGRFDDDTRVADLVAVVSQLQLDRPAMIGHSMGGATVGQAVARHAGLSRGAVLEDPAWSERTDEEIAAQREARTAYLGDWRRWVDDLQHKPRAEALAQRLADEPNWSPVDVGVCLDGRLAFQLDLFDHFPTERHPWRPLVPHIDCPTLLLLGGEAARGAIVTRTDAEEVSRINPLVTWVQIPGAGHHIKYDRFDDYMDEVFNFLEPLGQIG
jgi:N-formylmaleamate deformylase